MTTVVVVVRGGVLVEAYADPESGVELKLFDFDDVDGDKIAEGDLQGVLDDTTFSLQAVEIT